MSTIGTPPDYAEALVFTGAGEVQAYSARTADLASQPDFSSSDGTYTLIGMGNERVRLQRLADDTVSWYDRATTFDDATPVHVPIGDTTPDIDITTATHQTLGHGPSPRTQHAPQLITADNQRPHMPT